MSQFVTPIFDRRRVPDAEARPRSSADDAASATRAMLRRLATLRTPAPDTLRARVRRELRAAAVATTTRPE